MQVANKPTYATRTYGKSKVPRLTAKAKKALAQDGGPPLEKLTSANFNIAAIVEKYIEMRDELDAEVDALKEKQAKKRDTMAKMEAAILLFYERHGIDSTGTEKGTAYKSVRTSTKVADWQKLLPFIIKNEAWNLLEKRVSSSGLEEFLEENDSKMPPGVDRRSEMTLKVRRPTKKK